MTEPRRLAFICFILSGAASISYQLLWLRDAISHFGVITPVISVLLSVFMLGLAVGTYMAGRVSMRVSGKKALLCYAAIEVGIVVLALCVPAIFTKGYEWLLGYESLESSAYLIFSGLIIAVALFPVCVLIGATLPMMMRALENDLSDKRNFGVLYFANLIGALIGCILPLILIELLGMQSTLYVTVIFNLSAAALACIFASRHQKSNFFSEKATAAVVDAPVGSIDAKYKWFLFLTGFAAIGSEVLWVKAFTPATGSSVYAFALVLGVYLLANILGNFSYLKSSSAEQRLKVLLWLPLVALLPVFLTDMVAVKYFPFLMVPSIFPLSFFFGYLTPQVIDSACQGNPRLTARAYTYNFAGCILGPLCTGYALFPWLGLKVALVIHVVLLLVAVLILLERTRRRTQMTAATLALSVLAFVVTTNYEDKARKEGQLHRDWIGYVAASGEGMKKTLTVNGIGMTNLTPITKNMIHLPAAYHPSPKNTLIICMGMGTTLRSAVSWPMDSITVVELSRGVTKAFPYFYTDAETVRADPRVHIVVDDGRRFLLRNKTTYDIITIDPPPPIEASGSGLLYSSDFMGVIASRLSEKGILSHWIPEDKDPFIVARILAAITQNFKYVKTFSSVEGWGVHILASNQPFSPLTAGGFENKLPAKARVDLLEFNQKTPFRTMARDSFHEIDMAKLLPKDQAPRPLSDDRLYNEFFLLRGLGLYQ